METQSIKGRDSLTGKKGLVIGAGRSGSGSASLLLACGAEAVLYDGNTGLEQEKLKQDVRNLLLHECSFNAEDADSVLSALYIILGDLDTEIAKKADFAVLSPGVPTDSPLVEQLKKEGLPIWSEVELAYRVGRGKVIAITGTNGKTTTTALAGKIMEDACPSVFIVGNIGTAYTSKALETVDESWTVAEISSFQLETIDTFAPKASAILNITPDHLDRHHTMEEYIRVKELITKNQGTDDICVLNYEDPILRAFGENAVPRIIWFSGERELKEGFFLRGDEIILREGGQESLIVRTSQVKLLGRHNYENIMAAIALTYGVGVPMESIIKSVCEFQAVAHRIEFVLEKNQVAYYNDSKGTNPDAAIKGIQAMNRPTLLIGGGYDKHSDYEDWIHAFDGKVKKLVLIGQTKEKIKETAERCGFHDIILCEDLKEAVEICAKLAEPGDAVLLSPACASWGQFANYEQRGDMFKDMVRAL